MTTVLNSLHAHIRDEERALKEMKDTLKAHMDETARVNVDVRELGVDVRAIKEKLGELEKEVFALSKAKTSVIAWAAGVSATVSALWIVAGPRIATFLGG
jgi:predicted nuclease with TOPRIM domain